MKKVAFSMDELLKDMAHNMEEQRKEANQFILKSAEFSGVEISRKEIVDTILDLSQKMEDLELYKSASKLLEATEIFLKEGEND